MRTVERVLNPVRVQTQDSFYPWIIPSTYFVFVVFLGSFFIVNLALAVIWKHFSSGDLARKSGTSIADGSGSIIATSAGNNNEVRTPPQFASCSRVCLVSRKTSGCDVVPLGCRTPR